MQIIFQATTGSSGHASWWEELVFDAVLRRGVTETFRYRLEYNLHLIDAGYTAHALTMFTRRNIILRLEDVRFKCASDLAVHRALQLPFRK